VRAEGELGLLNESPETRVVGVRLLVEALGEKVLPEVVLTLLLVGLVPIAGVEALRQKELIIQDWFLKKVCVT
jgi:hypothetical protein